jgi:hypothetical protein
MPYFLILIGVILIVLNFKALKKEKNSFESIVRNKENNITDFDVAIGELRREFSETILELQQEIYEQRDLIHSQKESSLSQKESIQAQSDLIQSFRDLGQKKEHDENFIEISNEKLNKVKENNINERELKEEKKMTTDVEAESSFKLEEVKQVESQPSASEKNNIRIKEIGDLLDKGVALDDICEKYNIGKGEVLLIKELYLR